MARDYKKIKAWYGYIIVGRVELRNQVYKGIAILGHQNLCGTMGEGSGRFENTSRVDFLYRKVWGLKSEIKCLN
jgi:hypothetical protein